MARYTTEKITLLLGQKEAWTPLPWAALEETPAFLRGRGWVPVGTYYSVDSVGGTLDSHFKRYMSRATAGWFAVILETAGVVGLDRAPPARVKLNEGW